MGFFNKNSLTSKNGIKRNRQCGACGLYKTCNSPKMGSIGKGNRKVYLLAESPSQAEDRQGKQLIDKAGMLLKRKFKKLGIDIENDCWKSNSVLCRVLDKNGKARKATDHEIEYCRPSILKDIKQKQPNVIILLGSVAVKSFLGDRWQKQLGGIDKWRGWAIPDKDYNCWVLPVFHPSYVLRSEKDPIVETIFNNDIKKITEYIDKPLPELNDADVCCGILNNKDEVTKYLEEILKYKATFAFDYETTGLKPHAKGHKIASVAVCWQNNRAFSWEWELTPIKLYRQIMEDPNIKKIAANMKMEDHWTAVRARRIQIQGWFWDTMQAAHVQDQRKGITSLKFDVYKRYGVVNYDSSISHFLKSDSNEFGSNGLNNVFDAPREELLLYNAKDAFYTYLLACDQMKEMGMKL